MIKIVIVSNLAVLREGVKRILLPQEDIDVLAEFADIRELSSHNLLLQADVVIMIADMASANGSDYLLRLHQECPSLRVVMLLRYPTMQQILSILRAGVRGLLSASSAASQLPIAVRAISSGRLYLNDELTRMLIPDHSDIGKDFSHKSLTDREMEVFIKLTAGKKVSEIAAQLGISMKTVSTHKSRLMEKMNMSTFSQMVQYALAYGLCEPTRAD
jgi:two-component system, NarL family, invasion response regulator UvrY